MLRRYFEFIAGTSCKFWEVTVEGCAVTVRYGRIGTGGQQQVKDLPHPPEAQRHADELIRSKLRKGYVEAAVP
jgi:predicted DNA-binding WGR domain protein